MKPKIGENKFGGESVTYMGVGEQKKWERIESYGPKFVENIIQGHCTRYSAPCNDESQGLSHCRSCTR